MISACFTWYEGFRWVPLCPHHGAIFFWNVKVVGNKRKEQQLLMLVFATYNSERRDGKLGRGMRMTQSCVYRGQPFPCYQPIKEGRLLGSTEHGGPCMFLTTLVDICTSYACRNAHPRKWYHSDCCFMDALNTLQAHWSSFQRCANVCVPQILHHGLHPWESCSCYCQSGIK